MSKQLFRDRVRELRQKAGLTQRALAAKAGLSPAAVGRLEAEPGYSISRPAIVALAHAFSCDPDWLESGEGSQHGPFKSPHEVVASDRKMKEFLDSLPDAVRSSLRDSILAGGHYLDMESLLDNALKTRGPLPTSEQEADFKWMLKKWARQRAKGRAAVWRGINLLESLAQLDLRAHAVDKAVKSARDTQK